MTTWQWDQVVIESFFCCKFDQNAPVYFELNKHIFSDYRLGKLKFETKSIAENPIKSGYHLKIHNISVKIDKIHNISNKSLRYLSLWWWFRIKKASENCSNLKYNKILIFIKLFYRPRKLSKKRWWSSLKQKIFWQALSW